MISALSWIPRGVARLDPLYVEIGEDDEEAIKAMQDLEENGTVSWCSVAMHAIQYTFKRRNAFTFKLFMNKNKSQIQKYCWQLIAVCLFWLPWIDLIV